VFEARGGVLGGVLDILPGDGVSTPRRCASWRTGGETGTATSAAVGVMRARAAPTGRTEPTSASSSATTPSSKVSTSMTALSVSTAATMSPRCT
jgi:enterochelin esterase-like enzyme